MHQRLLMPPRGHAQEVTRKSSHRAQNQIDTRPSGTRLKEGKARSPSPAPVVSALFSQEELP